MNTLTAGLSKTAILAAIAFTGFQPAAHAQGQYQPKGYIQNWEGKQCWYRQTALREKHFHEAAANTVTLVFDDRRCMQAGNLAGQINMGQINFIISRPYSHQDANFKTKVEELYETSALQVRGKCMQSATYEMIAVLVDYQVENGFITGLKHAASVAGCKNR